MTLPCGCCPIGGCSQIIAPVAFAAVSAQGAGNPMVGLASTIDGSAGADLSGYSPPQSDATLAANPTWRARYTFAAPQTLVRLAFFNGGGGVLTDEDGVGTMTVTFLDAALVPIATIPWDVGPPAGNNNITRFLNFAPIVGVSHVEFGNMRKQNAAVFGAGSPLWRQVQAFQPPVRLYPCREGALLKWYDELGNEVPNGQLEACTGPFRAATPAVPFAPATTRLFWQFFGDAGATGEVICNITPAPTAFANATAAPPCFNPTGNSDFTWTPGPTSFTFDYANGVGPVGASLFAINKDLVGAFYSWTANATPMTAGESRLSLMAADGSYVRVTQLPFTGPAAGAVRMDGGVNLRIGPAAVVTPIPPYPVLVEFLKV